MFTSCCSALGEAAVCGPPCDGVRNHRSQSSATQPFRPSAMASDLLDPSISATAGWLDSISCTGSIVSASRICGPGASASSSGSRGAFASNSKSVNGLRTGRWASSWLCCLESPKLGEDAPFSAGNISMRSSIPLL